MGYRTSTPNNVIIAEAKVRLLRDRAHLLARNFLSKNLIYGERQLIEQIEEYVRKENYVRFRQSMLKRSILSESWHRVMWINRKTGTKKKFEQFEKFETQDSIIRDAQHKGKHYFENFYKRKMIKPWFYKINAERYYVTLINRLRANHYNVGESLARKGIIDSAKCEYSNENESIKHVIWRCSKYDEERTRLDQILRQKGITEEIDIENIQFEKVFEPDWTCF